MERYFKASLGFVMFAVLGMSIACKPEQKGCTGCCEEPGITKELVMPKSKEKVTLNFFNAMTPVNFNYCNQVKGFDIDGSCRPNFDSVFNDDINSIFAIDGYDPQQFKDNGLRTYLRIQTETDTTQIWPDAGDSGPKSTNYMDGQILFNGLVLAPVEGDMTTTKLIASGRYVYKFLIYDTVSQIISTTTTRPDNPFETLSDADSAKLIEDDFDKYLEYVERYNRTETKEVYGKRTERLIDSVVGKFCIIRNDYECPTSGCKGKQANDPLLH